MAARWKFLPIETIAGKKVHGHGDCSTVSLRAFISDVGLETRRKIDWMFDKSCPFASGYLWKCVWARLASNTERNS